MATAREQPRELVPGAPDAACPRCGAATAAYQEYCLECGLRLPLDAAALAGGGEGRVIEPPVTWVWPVLVALVVAVVATAAVVVARTAGDETAEAFTATTSPGTEATTDVPPEAPETVTAAPPPEPLEQQMPTQPRPPRRRGGLIEWPARDGFTVVLASLPKAQGRAAAVERANAAVKAGLRQVGVLDSDEYASLHPDYYVLFAGVFRTFDEAERATAEAADAGYAGAYPKEVAR